MAVTRQCFNRRLDQLHHVDSSTGSFSINPFFNSTIISFLPSSLHISGLSTNSIFWRAQAIYGDFIINCPAYQLATAFSDAGLSVYMMIFRASTQIHGASATFLNSPAPQTQDPELAAKMQDYWISFVKTMDPNGGKNDSSGVQRQMWPKYLVNGRNETSFSVLEVYGSDVSVKADEDTDGR
ncbi:hypothetical protein D6C98_08420 [Aureobasidium pullulans]|uniref:Carboxylesterase type B domain-containing protein n=1 Tax=Aureobasidium pullulans TaxID=5580 RepID=A0A4S9MKX4_AURPU|nr:hypothetical protein D6D10_03680 [Aureobasidium pullulans]THX78533.1 hypothetical protein D6D04_05702 [Aureobasidium pullulans]THY43841.1 hypothetical protein D6C98_08420 [Aureobasidium pullulans]